MDTTTGAKAPTLTKAELTALHAVAGDEMQRLNRATLGRLLHKGVIATTNTRPYYGSNISRWSKDYRLTPAGRAAHDAHYTPEVLAAMKAAADAETQAFIDERAERRRQVEAMAAQRTAAMARLRDLLGDAAPWWLDGEAKPHADYSGVQGGRSYGEMNASELLRYVDAAVARTEAQALAPVLCRDCDTYVPAGWIGRTDVACPATSSGAGSHSHRVYTDALQSAVEVALAGVQA